MSLFDLLPSLKGVLVTRSFDPLTWPLPMTSTGADIRVGDLDLREESCRRKLAFYLDDDGQPVCQSLCAPTQWFPVLVTRVRSAQITGGRAILHVDAAVPLPTAVADLAFPGNTLAGARMMDVTVVDLNGHRRTVPAELPANVVATGTIALALRPISAPDPLTGTCRSAATTRTPADRSPTAASPS